MKTSADPSAESEFQTFFRREYPDLVRALLAHAPGTAVIYELPPPAGCGSPLASTGPAPCSRPAGATSGSEPATRAWPSTASAGASLGPRRAELTVRPGPGRDGSGQPSAGSSAKEPP